MKSSNLSAVIELMDLKEKLRHLSDSEHGFIRVEVGQDSRCNFFKDGSASVESDYDDDDDDRVILSKSNSKHKKISFDIYTRIIQVLQDSISDCNVALKQLGVEIDD
ncbi:hypothetical protein EVB32_213 [Rhizobium phage RHph_TM39]|uniref:Uncharacterized protein n=2 Tax=Cuauhnahuacvirus TaxID=3044696 RepID=A0A7S5R801_9CAUD|nr:hypothetical protein PQC16_gp227 [Rhizobium phage RHph_TM30]YP_010671376.1 hypothetical protein PQC17_gp227 [Rhizobium phage RHph_Y65]QIG72423.1 hypothetical protein EVB96_227 [Rhizobium phage RHph_TM3_3_6]QIG77201.1 hypothetical protein EVB32_213 [Rhizobium phage RHph_TM39]QIG77514.1 hypothetical protein EVB61_186 [Rhizobium phage RHph_TM21B]QIG77813.1 hypothetical protein EVB64_226 [Rhizobium phage RHph_TM61]QIG71334.1 hypothetical protein EVB93_227 [Rhizobium phage RHph_TM30]